MENFSPFGVVPPTQIAILELARNRADFPIFENLLELCGKAFLPVNWIDVAQAFLPVRGFVMW